MKKIIIYIFALSLFLPALAFASFDVSLKYGSRGDAVVELQDFLQDQGVFSGKVDGRFGLGTRKAVIAFQLANGLKGDGYFGLGSRAKANSILTLELKSSLDAEKDETEITTLSVSNSNGCTPTSTYSATTGLPCNSNKATTFVAPTVLKPVEVPQTIILPVQNAPISVPITTSVMPKPIVSTPIAPIVPTVVVPTPIPPNNPIVTYSDYNFDYKWDNKILSCPMTPRNIVIKKAVFKMSESELQKINKLRDLESDGFKLSIIGPRLQYLSGTNNRYNSTFNLEKRDQNTYAYFGGAIPVCGDGDRASLIYYGVLSDTTTSGRNIAVYLTQKGISMEVSNGSGGDPSVVPGSSNAYFDIQITPTMSEWELWDNTTSKPVKIN